MQKRAMETTILGLEFGEVVHQRAGAQQRCLSGDSGVCVPRIPSLVVGDRFVSVPKILKCRIPPPPLPRLSPHVNAIGS